MLRDLSVPAGNASRANSLGSRFLSLALAVALVVPGSLAAPTSAHASSTTTRVSVTSAGAQVNDESTNASISGNGRYVVFESIATNLVPSDTNGARDIFIKDLQTGDVERVSVSSTGTQGNGNSFNPSVSDDGRYVAFESVATDLVSSDSNGYKDIFVRDRQSGTTRRVSVSTGNPGTQSNGLSENAVISGDGRFVAFESAATNLVSGDSNTLRDVFVRDLTTNATTRVSVANGSPGAQAVGGGSRRPSISTNGQYVAFESRATNLIGANVDTNGKSDIFVRDRTGNTTVRVSVTSGGAQATGDSQNPSISGDGAIVAFESYATNLVAGDTNGAVDVFVRGRTGSPATQRVSVTSSGAQANWASYNPSLSQTGRLVAFDSAATNLIAGDTNGSDDVFVRDRTAGTTVRVSESSAGVAGNNHSQRGSVLISGSDMVVVFDSIATNLVAGDTNAKMDVFVNGQAPLATVTGVSSTTHPSSTTWYSSNTPRFAWTGVDNGGGVDGYSFSLSQSSATVPDDVEDTDAQFWQSGAVADGVWYFKVKAANDVGAWGPVAGPVTVRIDATAPSGTMVLGGGAQYTGSVTVSVTSDVSFGPSGPNSGGAMRFRVDGGAWGAWLAYSVESQVTLPASDGPHTVDGEFRDGAGNTTILSDSIELDTTVPSIVDLTSPSHGASGAWSNQRTVTFTWVSSADQDGYSTSWSQNPAEVPDETVDVTEGSYQASDATDGIWYFKVRAKKVGQDRWGAASTLTVRVDGTAPTGSIVINGGASSTSSTAVIVTNSVSFSVSGEHPTQAMRFSTNNGSTWTTWETYNTSKALTLTAGDGTKTVRGEFRDAAGNVATLTDTITLTTAPTTATVTRLADRTRFSTAVAIARAGFPNWTGVKDVVIASGDDRAAADPLAASGLCWAYDAPMLLVSATRTPDEVKAAVKEIVAKNGSVTLRVVGGPVSVPDARLAEIQSFAGGSAKVKVDRILRTGGRYDLAAAIALRMRSVASTNPAKTMPSVALFANGADATKFFDALALSPISAGTGAPILLVSATSVPPATLNAVNTLKPSTRIVGGGPNTVSETVRAQLGATRWSGRTRYDTAIAIANGAVSKGWLNRANVGIASKLPDALTGGGFVGQKKGVLLLTDGASLTPVTASWLTSNKSQVRAVWVFGGALSVTETVMGQIRNALK